MPTAAAPNVRVVVRLPWNRPEQPLNDPPRIEWTPEKADILWKVIERSRASDSGGADWKALAAHLEVPLPYLLYRVNARFQQEIRGLQGVVSPSATQPPSRFEDLVSPIDHPTPTLAVRTLSRASATGSTRLSSSSARLSTPLGIRARLNSLGHNALRPKRAVSSSTITVQGPKRPHSPVRPVSPSSSEGSDSDDEDAAKEEEAERHAEEQEALDKKLQDLQRMMTSETLGLVSSKGKKRYDRGRMGASPPRLRSSPRSQSLSSTSSPQGSIPDIPSPPVESQPHSPMGRHSHSKSMSPPAVSPRSAIEQSNRRYNHFVGKSTSEHSSHGSETSSFSDLSDTDLSASALESALMSNIRGNGSRFSTFTSTRSRFGGR